MPPAKRIPILVVLAAAVVDSFIILLKGISPITIGSLIITLVLLAILIFGNK